MAKFKVGDRVRVVPSRLAEEPGGQEAIVIPYEPRGSYDYKILLDTGYKGLVWEHELAPVYAKIAPLVTRSPTAYMLSVNGVTLSLTEEEAKRLHRELADLFLP
jgi:hypothetical protein